MIAAPEAIAVLLVGVAVELIVVKVLTVMLVAEEGFKH